MDDYFTLLVFVAMYEMIMCVRIMRHSGLDIQLATPTCFVKIRVSNPAHQNVRHKNDLLARRAFNIIC